jgi:hypothetical protein
MWLLMVRACASHMTVLMGTFVWLSHRHESWLYIYISLWLWPTSRIILIYNKTITLMDYNWYTQSRTNTYIFKYNFYVHLAGRVTNAENIEANSPKILRPTHFSCKLLVFFKKRKGNIISGGINIFKSKLSKEIELKKLTKRNQIYIITLLMTKT